MSHQLLALAFCFCILQAVLSDITIAHKANIAGGTACTQGEFAHNVALVLKSGNNQFCGGSVLDETHILTAAHCFVGDVKRKAEEVYIMAGKVDLTAQDANTQSIEVAQVITHANYTPSISQSHDIAVVVLKKRLVLSEGRVEAVSLETGELTTGTLGYVTGWGHTESQQSSAVLRKVQIPIATANTCKPFGVFDSKTMICAGSGDGKDSCIGDSGGALVRSDTSKTNKWVAYGLVSYGPNPCGARGNVGFYTKVSNYVDWIENAVRATNSATALISSPIVMLSTVAISLVLLLL